MLLLNSDPNRITISITLYTAINILNNRTKTTTISMFYHKITFYYACILFLWIQVTLLHTQTLLRFQTKVFIAIFWNTHKSRLIGWFLRFQISEWPFLFSIIWIHLFFDTNTNWLLVLNANLKQQNKAQYFFINEANQPSFCQFLQWSTKQFSRHIKKRRKDVQPDNTGHRNVFILFDIRSCQSQTCCSLILYVFDVGAQKSGCVPPSLL